MMRSAALSASVGLAVGAYAQPVVHLRYAPFDPLVSTPGVPAALEAPAASRLFIVQFPTTPGPTQRASLESRGCALLRYIPDHAYLVRAPANVDPGAIPGVRWSGPYHGAYRLDPSLLGAVLSTLEAAGAPVLCGIELTERGVDAQAALDTALRAMGSGVIRFQPEGARVEAALTPAQLLAVARLDVVSFIDPSGPPGSDMDIVRPLAGASYLQTQIGASGQGVRGEVLDSAIDVNFPPYQNPPPLLHGPNGTNPDAHAAATYGILFGNDPLDPSTRGMLPDREQGIFSSYQQVGIFPNPTHLAEIVNPNLRYRGVFLSTSIGNAQVSTYTTISAASDDALFQVDIAVAQSMSNTGTNTARPQAWAKNIVAVGGVNHQDTLTRADDTSGSASTGPASDGRIKPDVAHVMDSVRTVVPAPMPPVFSGTSAATPITAGHLGLICQMWHEQVFSGFGGGASVFADRPRAATIRALLINSAHQYDWALGGPNGSITRSRQGWGMPDLQPLYDRRDRTFIVNETDPLAPGGSRSYQVVVQPGETALKATMVYLDPAGSPAVQAQHRVNDLTLKLRAPDGLTTYWGNHGLAAGIWSPPGGVPDTKNVVENVFVQNPPAGHWLVEVSAPELVMDARLETPEVDADFALVISGATECPFACYPDCTGDCQLTIADFACFQAAFVNGDPYADCNGQGGLTIADFACYQSAFVAGCP